MRNDFSFAFRSLRHTPAFTMVAVLSLALGIGANTAIFSLLDQVILRLLPVRAPEQLVVLHTEYNAPGNSTSDNFESVFSNPLYRKLSELDPAFAGAIARSGTRGAVSYGGSTDSVAIDIVSGNFFTELGVPAAAGRLFMPDDDGAPGAHAVAVLSSGYWGRRFGSDSRSVNQKITLNGQPMVVIGVVSPRFAGIMPGSTPDVYVPIAMKRTATPTFDGLEDPQMRWLNIFGRLKPGWTMERAQTVTGIAYHAIMEDQLGNISDLKDPHERSEFQSHKLELHPAAQGINGLRRQWETPLEALMAMVGVVLLIACANVASLMLARAAGRRREIAIRLAMGAGRLALLKQLLVEGLILAIAGGVLGLLVASWSMETLIRLLPGGSPAGAVGSWLSAAIDMRLLAFTFALAVASGILFALLPALQATRSDVAETLKNHSAAVAFEGRPARFRKAIVTGQIALSLLLVVGAGLFAASLARLMNVDLGFRAQRLLMFSIDARVSRHGLQPALAFYQDFEDRLAHAGEIEAVAAANNGPFSGSARGGNITVQGYAAKPHEYTGSASVAVNAGYFRSMGVPLAAGREFTLRDNAAAPHVAVVNEAFVKRYFSDRNAIGHRLQFGSSDHPKFDIEIVGVVADTRSEVRKAAKETIFTPYLQAEQPDRMTFYVRTAGDESRFANTVRQLARSMDPNIPVRNIKQASVQISESIYADRLIAVLSIAFGVLATLLAAIGLYGVVAYSVARRTPEIGIRMALGAVPAEVLRMVLLDACRTAGIGIAIGLAGAWALSRYVETQLFGVKASDPGIFAAAALLLTAVVLAAAMVPGHRASRINPMSALKYE
jgi:predicted permease